MLKIRNLYAGYGNLQVLKGVDIDVKPAEIVALIGPNGAGKSTVIKAIYRIADVTQGKITFKGEDITDLDIYEQMELGISYVPQGRINFSTLTVLENLKVGAEFIRDKDLIEKNIKKVFEKFPALEEKKNKHAFTLSGGQQQMLALGRALMQNPSLLLLDEPSLGLSPKLQKELFETIKKLKEDGISILVVEQNAKKAIEIADRTYLLEDGQIALKGGKEILKNKKIRSIYLGGRY